LDSRDQRGGFWLMARRDPVGIRLITRRGNDWTQRAGARGREPLKVRSCLIDGEVVCCDEREVAAFSVLRRRRTKSARSSTRSISSSSTERRPTPRTDRGAQGHARQHPAQEPARCAAKRAT
jgi:hypothetical protein